MTIRVVPRRLGPAGAWALAAWLAGAGGALAQIPAAEPAPPEVTEAALAVLPEGVRPEDICRSGAEALPHLGQLWPAEVLARLELHPRRAAGMRRLFASAAPGPDPDGPDWMVMEIARPGPFDGDELWLRLRPSDRLRGGGAGDLWLHFATGDTVAPEVRAARSDAPAGG